MRRRILIEQSKDGIAVLDVDGSLYEFNASFARMLGYTEQEMHQLHVWDWNKNRTRDEVLARLRSFEKEAATIETRHWRKDGSSYDVEVSISPAQWGGRTYLYCVHRDITARKEAQREVEKLHKELLLASRQAGMAEVATSVLHNVGNVLNSINVSATVLAEKLSSSKIGSVAQVSGLLDAHAADLVAFLTTDPTGRELPAYLNRLAARLAKENALLLKEIGLIQNNVDHVKDIVGMQQNYAKVFGVVERVKPKDLIEDAVRMNAGALVRHDVQVVREYARDIPEIMVEKHKVLQILVNLIRNAKYACDESGHADKILTLRLSASAERIAVTVADNGVGILPENMNRIFNHGFTTRKNGHGFGLHSSALAAGEMGGTLSVRSDGPQRGAAFTLELPLEPPRNADE